MPLTLPVQGAAIERGQWNFYEPYLHELGTYTNPDTGAPGILLGNPPPTYGHGGTVIGDPGPLACRDTRGWQCQPMAGCIWVGVL
ncbi:hypothetical protein ACWD6P_09080 [Streptomyces sp. NPDC002446]